MRRGLSRLLLTVACSIAALGATSATAGAAITVTTSPATGVTSTSAVLHGTVSPGGSPLVYQFQYGASTQYGKGTSIAFIGGGVAGPVQVSATISGLNPFTTYHFRIAAFPVLGTTPTPPYYYLGGGAVGQDRTFKTNGTGRLLLSARKLFVRHGRIAIKLDCASSLPCKGKFTLTTRLRVRRTRRFGQVVCATTSFSVPANRTRTIDPKVRSACLAALRKARHHRLTTKLTSYPRTGQHALIRKVTLILP
jgi:hypothetical protein